MENVKEKDKKLLAKSVRLYHGLNALTNVKVFPNREKK